MPPLLVIPALPRPRQGTPDSWPALPALGELLRLADAEVPDAGWRAGLLRDLGIAVPVPEAVVAASPMGLEQGAGVCLAAPVHVVAGMHRVHLHAAGVLSLDAEERAQFAQAFAAQFGPDAQLREAGRQWLLQCACAASADDTDPLDWRGAPLERTAARSPEQKQLRRLGAEIEMWLADLPLNARRRGRGRLPVNLLWLWGGGRVAAVRAPGVFPGATLHGDADDAWLAGCAALSAHGLARLPDSWPVPAPDDVVVLPFAADATALAEQHDRWIAPALHALRSGQLAALRLRAGGRLYHVRRGLLRGLLRRHRPWWKVVEA